MVFFLYIQTSVSKSYAGYYAWMVDPLIAHLSDSRFGVYVKDK